MRNPILKPLKKFLFKLIAKIKPLSLKLRVSSSLKFLKFKRIVKNLKKFITRTQIPILPFITHPLLS